MLEQAQDVRPGQLGRGGGRQRVSRRAADVTPRALQAAMSMALLRMPVVISNRSLGKAWMRAAGNGVRSRMATITSKSASSAST